MKGFDTKALILFPKMESYNLRDVNYKYEFKRAVTNLCNYLAQMGIAPHAFYTDDVARELNTGDFQYVSTLGRSDRFFVHKYCQGMSDAMNSNHISFDSIVDKYIDADVDVVNMSTEERFELVLTRNAKAVKDIIKTYKLVIHFKRQGNAQYTVTSKQGDGRILIEVNSSNFIPTVYMSGVQVHPIDILAVPYANKPLNTWEVKANE